jgi:hypothetical protein
VESNTVVELDTSEAWISAITKIEMEVST